MANPAEIQVAVTARIDQLQQALQKAEAVVKNSAAKMQKDIGQAVKPETMLGKNVDLGGALGMAMKGAAILKIADGLLSGMKAGVDAYNQGGGAKQVAGAVVSGFYDSIKAIPIAGQAASLVEALFYGAEQEAERRAQELADKTAAALEKGAARLEAKAAGIKGIRAAAGRLTAGIGATEAQKIIIDRNQQLNAIQDQIDAEENARNAARKRAESKDVGIRSVAIAEIQVTTRTIEALEALQEATKAAADEKYEQVVASQRAAEQAKKEAEATEQAREAEKQRNADLAKQRKDLEKQTKAAIEGKQAELDALQAVTPANRQAQMMRFAQSSAASMMGSVGTALGEFKFAQKGLGDMALAEAKKQTEKQIKIEQLQADMKAIQQEMLRKLDSMSMGVS